MPSLFDSNDLTCNLPALLAASDVLEPKQVLATSCAVPGDGVWCLCRAALPFF